MGHLFVLAGTNGAGKSSVAGEMFRATGQGFYNPDEAAAQLRTRNPGLEAREANATAWRLGTRLLERAIRDAGVFAFETTLGGTTITKMLREAIASGVAVHVWYVALASPELHLERIRARVAEGGHDIPEAEVRKRYDTSRLNLIELMPGLAALRVYDNSKHADLAAGEAPEPRLILSMVRRKVTEHCDLATAPTWAKPILAAAFTIDPAPTRR